MRPIVLLLLAGCGVAALATAWTEAAAQGKTRNSPSPEPAAQRKAEIVRMVRQDCGSCHGMLLTGGLGPPLTPQALADKPFDSLVAVVLSGRPGSAMPPWAAFLSEDEAVWIIDRLMRGFPNE